MSGGIWHEGLLSSGYMSGGICPGGICPGGICPRTIKPYRMTSHLFGGIWCSSSSSYALKNTSELTNDAIVKNIITSSFYVDDLLWSSKSLDESTRLMAMVKSLLSTRGFQTNKIFCIT